MRATCAALILCGLVVACQSPAGLREDSMPVLVETTTKPADQVAGCIGDKLEAQNSSLTQITYSTRPTATGFSISGTQSSYVLAGGTDTILLIDIARQPTGSQVTMYTHFLVGDGPNAYFSAVRGCI